MFSLYCSKFLPHRLMIVFVRRRNQLKKPFRLTSYKRLAQDGGCDLRVYPCDSTFLLGEIRNLWIKEDVICAKLLIIPFHVPYTIILRAPHRNILFAARNVEIALLHIIWRSSGNCWKTCWMELEIVGSTLNHYIGWYYLYTSVPSETYRPYIQPFSGTNVLT